MVAGQQYRNPVCFVCGSTAFKVQFSTNRLVCRAHEYVCEHGKDPCSICDGGEK